MGEPEVALARVSAEQEDALREVANIMVGHAATALARLSDTRIDLEIPTIRLLTWHDGVAAATEDARIVAGVRTRMLGRLTGEVFVTFPRDSALALVDVLRGLPRGSTQYMNSGAASTLVEVGNIIAGSCLAAFYQLLDISLVHSVPEFVYDVPSVLMAPGIDRAAVDTAIVAEVAFRAPQIDFEGHLLLLFTVESLTRLLDALETPG